MADAEAGQDAERVQQEAARLRESAAAGRQIVGRQRQAPTHGGHMEGRAVIDAQDSYGKT